MGYCGLSETRHGVVQCDIQQMLEMGVIEQCSTTWVSPMAPVAEMDGTQRVCVDYYCLLSKVTMADPFSMPRVESTRHQLVSAKFFTFLDLPKGY